MKIAFTGDISFNKYFLNTYNKEDLLDKETLDFLNSGDVTVANVEGAIFSGTGSAKKALVHSNPPEMIDFLRKINAGVWNIANNHIIDCGEEGLKYTIDYAKKNGCKTLGIGETIDGAEKSVILTDENGVKVGLISVTQEETPAATETECGCVRYDNCEQIEKMISKNKSLCDWCVLIVHAGEEFNALPLPYIRNLYRKYLELGADIVVGHHPHVVENYEIVEDKIIFYSLGNFVFDTDYQRKQDYTENGVLVKIDFGKSSFTWEALGIKVDREAQRIVASDLPVIFTNIDSELYKILWPLSAKVLQLNNRVKFAIIFPSKKDYTAKDWEKWEKERAVISGKECRKGVLLYRFGKWKAAPEKLVNYIKGKRL